MKTKPRIELCAQAFGEVGLHEKEKVEKVERVYSGTLPQWIPRIIYEFKSAPKRG